VIALHVHLHVHVRVCMVCFLLRRDGLKSAMHMRHVNSVRVHRSSGIFKGADSSGCPWRLEACFVVASVKQRNGLPCRADTNESLSQSGTSFLGCLRTSFQIKLLAFCILGASLSPLYPLLCPLLLSRRFTNHFCLL